DPEIRRDGLEARVEQSTVETVVEHSAVVVEAKTEIVVAETAIAEVVSTEAEGERAHERRLPCVDPGLERVTLLLGEPARRDGGIDLVVERMLECCGQRARRDMQLASCIVDDRLALRFRRFEFRCSYGTSRGDDCRHGDNPCDPITTTHLLPLSR